ncbi:hypothetical protein N6H14_02530 [Paenibacillus sp. CC-CFT747]|nr:hypothetical protein N6H14_02530 [Paenibacillus sp. CC-CFT747]
MNGTNDQRETERSRRSRKLMEEGRRLYLDDLAKQLDRLGELLKEEGMRRRRRKFTASFIR